MIGELYKPVYPEPYYIPVTITDPQTREVVERRELRVVDTPDGAIFGEEDGDQQHVSHQTDEYGEITYDALGRLMRERVLALSRLVEDPR